MKKVFLIILLFIAVSYSYSQLPPPVPIYPSGDSCVNYQNVHFNWHHLNGAASYRIQVSSGANIILNVSGIADTFYIPAVGAFTMNTFYYWSLKAYGMGDSSSWASYWHFATCPGNPDPPVLLGPPDSSVVSLFPVFDWTDVPGATQYRIQISISSDFATTILNIGGLTNSGYIIASAILTNNTKYYWRVNASNAGGTSQWSSVWRFITVPAPPYTPNLCPVNRGKPVYSDSATIFEWHKVATATSYRIQVAANPSFPVYIINEVVYDTLYIAPPGTFTSNAQYYLRVNASNSGGTSPWTSVYNFSVVNNPPIPPILISPLNNAVNISLTPLLDWSDVPSATSYRVQVSQNQNFNNPIVNTTTSSFSSQYTILSGVLSYNTKYYWRANASNTGGPSIWSDIWNFTTLNNIGIKQISSEIPDKYILYQNYPNPFNPNTTIKFQIKDSRFVTLKVFDMLGKEVKALVNEKLSPGIYEVNFDGSNLPSGMYFYTIRSEDFTDTKRMLLIK